MEAPKPFTPKMLAERWACSENHIYDLIAKRKLRSFRVGGKLLRISLEEVLRWESAPVDRDSGFTPKMLAERWACTESHIYNLIASSALRSFRVGARLVRVSVEEVHRWERGEADPHTGPTASEHIGSTGMSTSSPRVGRKTAKGGAIDLASQRKMARDLRSTALHASSKS